MLVSVAFDPRERCANCDHARGTHADSTREPCCVVIARGRTGGLKYCSCSAWTPIRQLTLVDDGSVR